MSANLSAKSAYEKIQSLLLSEQLETINGDDYLLGNEDYSEEVKSHEVFSNALVPMKPIEEDVLVGKSREEMFQSSIETYVLNYGLSPTSNVNLFAAIAGDFAQISAQHYNQVKKFLFQPQNRHTTHRVASNLRSERDLWSLLQILAMSNLLTDINIDQCNQALETGLTNLPIVATIPEYINTAYAVDARIKKGAVIKEWLEDAVKDQVLLVPAMNLAPWSDTLYTLMEDFATGNNRGNSATMIDGIYPDAQISKQGELLPLLGDDSLDQLRLLTSIWSLIRAGQVIQAQQLAMEHQVYWLASSLRGMDPHYYAITPAGTGIGEEADRSMMMMEEEAERKEERMMTTRLGNVHQSLWLKTCYQYAEFLTASSSSTANRSSSTKLAYGSSSALITSPLPPSGISSSSASSSAVTVSILEQTIYASLSNHLPALLQSPLLTHTHLTTHNTVTTAATTHTQSTFQDHLWVYMKAIYNRDLTRILYYYTQRKQAHSAYYPGCDKDGNNIEAQEFLLKAWERSLEEVSLDSEMLAHTFFTEKYLPLPSLDSIDSSSNSSNSSGSGGSYSKVEKVIMHLQAKFIMGLNKVKEFLSEEITKLLAVYRRPGVGLLASSGVGSVGVEDREIMRIYVHIILWCKFMPNSLDISSASSSGLDNSSFNGGGGYQVVEEDLFQDLLEMYLLDHLLVSSASSSTSLLLSTVAADPSHSQADSSQLSSCIAIYCLFLSHHRRVTVYAQVLYTLQQQQQQGQGQGGQGGGQGRQQEEEILHLAHRYFPQDVPEIMEALFKLSATLTTSSSSTAALRATSQASVTTANATAMTTTMNSSRILPELLTPYRTKRKASSSTTATTTSALQQTSPSDEMIQKRSNTNNAANSKAALLITEQDQMTMESLRWYTYLHPTTPSSMQTQQQQQQLLPHESLYPAVCRVIVSLLLKGLSSFSSSSTAISSVSTMNNNHNNHYNLQLIEYIYREYLPENILDIGEESYTNHNQAITSATSASLTEKLSLVNQSLLWRMDKAYYNFWSDLSIVSSYQLTLQEMLGQYSLQKQRLLYTTTAIAASNNSNKMMLITYLTKIEEMAKEVLLPAIEGLFVMGLVNKDAVAVASNSNSGSSMTIGMMTIWQDGLQGLVKCCENILTWTIMDTLGGNADAAVKDGRHGGHHNTSSSSNNVDDEKVLQSTISIVEQMILIFQERGEVAAAAAAAATAVTSSNMVSGRKVDYLQAMKITLSIDAVVPSPPSSATAAATTTNKTQAADTTLTAAAALTTILTSLQQEQQQQQQHYMSTETLGRLHKDLSMALGYLQDYLQLWSLREMLTYYLLTSYLTTCHTVSQILCSSSSAAGQVEDEQEEEEDILMQQGKDLLMKGWQLSNLIASDDPAMKLYEILSSEHLESLVSLMNQAAFKLLPNHGRLKQ